MTVPSKSERVRGLMRDVGGVLRPLGFRGSRGLWRAVMPAGCAVVAWQGSQGSTSAQTLFFLEPSVVPVAWLEWLNTRRQDPVPIERARPWHGLRLLERRVEWTNPGHGDDGFRDTWLLTASTNMDSLREDLCAGATAEARRALELLEPHRYRDELLALPEKQIGHWEALTVLVACDGTSQELEEVIDGLQNAFSERPAARGYVERLTTWARARVHEADAINAPG